MASSDETPVTRQALMDVLNGKTQISDYNDPKFDVYKLLRGDVKNVATVKKAPFENFDIQNWNVSDANFPRDYSILVGTNAFYTQTVNKVYSLTYSQTASMPAKWPTLQKMEDETFLKIIMGAAPLPVVPMAQESNARPMHDAVSTSAIILSFNNLVIMAPFGGCPT